jgi:hypothetical protein
MPIVKKFWGLQIPGTLRASAGLHRDSFTIYLEIVD